MKLFSIPDLRSRNIISSVWGILIFETNEQQSTGNVHQGVRYMDLNINDGNKLEMEVQTSEPLEYK